MGWKSEVNWAKNVKVKMMVNSRRAKYNRGSEDLTDKNQVYPLIRCYIHWGYLWLNST